MRKEPVGIRDPAGNGKGMALKRGLFGKSEMSRLINPGSVAVVGASPMPGAFGMATLQNIASGYTGLIYPINPKYESILGHVCYRTVRDTPTVPDCVVLTISKDRVLTTLEECAQLGVGGAVVYTSGFSELGTARDVRQQQDISALARESGMRICGPNCIGIVNVAARIGMTFMPKLPMILGPVGVVSQSGALGYMLMQGMERGIGFSHYLSPGNSSDVDVCDFLNYLVEDDNTKAVVCTMEGIRDGQRLIEASRRALAAGKPLVVCKMGKSEISKRTALSHTGTLAGSDAAYTAALTQTGAILVEDFDALLETASFLSKVGPPSAKGIGVMAVSGGAAVMAADRAAERGIELPPSLPETAEKLRKVVPAFGSVQNPADITAESLKNPEMYGYCISAFAHDPHYGAVVVPMMSASAPATVRRAEYLSKLAATLGKPMCVVWLNEWYEGPGSREYDSSASICMFRSMGNCFSALKHWMTWHERREELLRPPTARLTESDSRRSVLALLGGKTAGRALTERESKQVLAAYGITTTRERHADSAESAVQAARKLEFPVVMKAESADIPHKTDAGVVRLNLNTETEVRQAYSDITAIAATLPGTPKVDGVVVQEMVRDGLELILGTSQDPQFGTLVVCGLGGVFVELMKDVAVAVAPVDMPRARQMIRSLKGYPLLKGYRGSAPLDENHLAQMLCRLSELASDFPDEIGEIDVNPIILTASGGVAVDALVVLATEAGGS